MAVLRVDALPDEAVAAAAQFYEVVLPRLLALLNPPPKVEDFVTLIFPPANHSHRAWRLAAVQGLARAHAPQRVNALESADEAAIAAAEAYLAKAPGVTGQYLPLDAAGATGA